jgi:hypothetical protein
MLYHTDYILREDRTWDRRCVGIEATSALFQLASTAGSMPKVGRVDLAAIVLNREKLLAENVRFGTIVLSMYTAHASFIVVGLFLQETSRTLRDSGAWAAMTATLPSTWSAV